MATVNLGRIKFVWQGAYSGATAYVADDVVSYNGSSYICILASTGNLPTNATYWSLMAQSGTDITSLAGLAQGDVLYYNGTSWVRLGAGTSGQFLKTNGSGANPSWHTLAVGANAGEVIQVLSATDSTQRTTSSTSFVTASNTLSVTITPASTSNKIFILVSSSGRTSDETVYTVYRGATDLGAASNRGLATMVGEPATANAGAGVGISYLDSPSTVSATTYQVYLRQVATATGQLNWNNSKGSITVMEIKG